MSQKYFVLYANRCEFRAALLEADSGEPTSFTWRGVSYSERVQIDQFHHLVGASGQLNGFVFDMFGRNERMEKRVSERLNACPGVLDDSGTIYVRLVDGAELDHDGSSVICADFYLSQEGGIIARLPWMSEWGIGESKWQKLWDSLGFKVETEDVPVPVFST